MSNSKPVNLRPDEIMNSWLIHGAVAGFVINLHEVHRFRMILCYVLSRRFELYCNSSNSNYKRLLDRVRWKNLQQNCFDEFFALFVKLLHYIYTALTTRYTHNVKYTTQAHNDEKLLQLPASLISNPGAKKISGDRCTRWLMNNNSFVGGEIERCIIFDFYFTKELLILYTTYLVFEKFGSTPLRVLWIRIIINYIFQPPFID